MGMFDWYEPIPDLECPVCKVNLSDWQGKDGACGLFVWRQGIAFAIDQKGDDCNIDERERIKFRLPETFRIYTNCENHWIEAECKTENAIWSETIIKEVEDYPKKLPKNGMYSR